MHRYDRIAGPLEIRRHPMAGPLRLAAQTDDGDASRSTD
jgi:hypothetical protein